MSRNPFQLADDPTLGQDAILACQRSPEQFFAEDPRLLERAKTLCASCPIRSDCLQDALTRAEPWGVWGGQIVTHGRVVASKRGRGRPRKTTAA